MSVTLRALRVKTTKISTLTLNPKPKPNHFPSSKRHERSATKLSKGVGLLANKTIDELLGSYPGAS